MKLLRQLIIVLLLTLSFCYAKGQEEPYIFSTISIEEGLSQLSVIKIHQDFRGYLWFATRNGLNRYDGSTFKIYKKAIHNNNGLANNHLAALAEDKNHCLWVGGVNGLSVVDLMMDKARPYAKLNKIDAISNGINALCVDDDNHLWIGTSHGLFIYDHQKNILRELYFRQINSNDFYVTCLKVLSDKRIVIGTSTAGILIYDPQKKSTRQFYTDSKQHPINSNNIANVYQDKDNRLWIATKDHGFNMIDFANEKTLSYTKENSKLTTNNTRDIIQMNNHILIGTFDGLYTLDLHNYELAKQSNDQITQGQLSHFSIYSLFLDKHDGLWVGTYSGGVNYYSQYKDRFTLHTSPEQCICGPVINFGKQAYVATEGSGLMEYNLQNDRYTCYLYDTSSRLHSRNIIKSLTKDEKTIWCGTTDGELYAFDPSTKKFTLHYTMNITASVYGIHKNKDNSFWLVTSNNQSGLLYISPEGKAENIFSFNDGKSSMRFPSQRCLLALDDDLLLIGSRTHGLYKYDVKKGEITNYNNNLKGKRYIPSDYITSITKDQKGRIWISTFGGGLCLFDINKGVVKTITEEDGLANNEICMVVKDQKGLLWLSSTHCISSFNPETNEVHNYQGHPISSQEFTPHTGIQLDNGAICFSANNGFISFNPNHIAINHFTPTIIFNELSVNNNRIEPDKKGILTTVLDDTKKIKLKYNQNNIIISYCAVNFSDPELCQYSYRLKGHDEKWNDVGNRREAYYTNLAPGKYTFQLKAANNDGIWGKDIRQIQITVKPPLWATWYAYLFYLSVLAGIGWIILQAYNRTRRMKQEQKEQQQREQFNQEKLSMFTNLFHELRTPLQLIISPVEELGKQQNIDLNIRNKLDLIYNNSQRLLILVNQMMDLRKSQTGKLHLKVSQDDIYLFINETFIAFKQLALDKNISLTFNQEGQNMQAWYDKFLFEKVLFNLLSNAMKNTSANGHIQILANVVEKKTLDEDIKKEFTSLRNDARMLVLEVVDDGKGIPENELTRIFEPFYQATNSKKKEIGTGIGLSLTRSIIDLHHGIIKASNNKEGGAHFWLTFSIDKDLYRPEDFDESTNDQVVTDVLPSTLKHEELNIEKKYTVLLVEDNDDVRKYIANCLEPYFYVIEASDGKTGLAKASDKMPDIVVSDVMMPKMDGLEMCKHIKEDMLIGHIPVILMTAKSLTVHIIEGYATGADDYIVKPFNIDILIYRIKNIIEARGRLKEKYGKTFSPEAIGIDITEGSDRFMQKFFSVIEKNLSNADLNVDMICKEIGVSRTNLYRKMKNVTELSPIELIRNKRLDTAAHLLVHSDLSIFDIAVRTGFNSQAYFSKCFKAVYGCAPSEYAEQEKKAAES